MDFSAYKVQYIEILTTATPSGNSITIQDQPFLRNKYIMAMEVLTAGTITVSPQTYVTTLAIAEMKVAFIEFVQNGFKIGNRIPLLSLNRTQNSATDPFVRDLFKVNGWVPSWDQCTIYFNATPTADRSITLVVYYQDFAPGKLIDTPIR